MRENLVSDTSCLILLTKIGQIDLLRQVFGEIVITSAVVREFGLPLQSWINVTDPAPREVASLEYLGLGAGEISVIALAVERGDCLLAIDDQRARKAAERLDLNVTGTLGVLIEAKRSGIIPSISPMIDEIQLTNFRLSSELINLALDRAGE